MFCEQVLRSLVMHTHNIFAIFCLILPDVLLFTPFTATRFAMHRVYANRINFYLYNYTTPPPPPVTPLLYYPPFPTSPHPHSFPSIPSTLIPHIRPNKLTMAQPKLRRALPLMPFVTRSAGKCLCPDISAGVVVTLSSRKFALWQKNSLSEPKRRV